MKFNDLDGKMRVYETANDRVLAGEAIAKFSSLLGSVGAFDCRISELPNKKSVED
ncbi:hypothetical protein [Pedobacter suwonensis]|uniref:hypothetical protein n=1 Tax=Pedobacter suwonensis TaxID=332999 RepID=UPI0025EFCCB8|nr:hypothetical protein [uncultured Pedobacter sp.]